MACEVHNEILRFVRPATGRDSSRNLAMSRIVQPSKFSGVS